MRPVGEFLFLYLIHFPSPLPSVHFQLFHSTLCYSHSTSHGLPLKDLDKTGISIYRLGLCYEIPLDFPGTVN